MKNTPKTKSKPQLVAELDDLRTELRKHITAETDAARAEEAMWQTQIALLALFNNLPGMAYRTAFDASFPNGRVEFVSGGCLKLTGHPAADYVTTPTLYRQQIVHPDDRARVLKTIADAEVRHEPFSLTYRIITKDGQLRWMDEHGTAMYNAKGEFVAREGFITDVTERMMHLEELRRQHTELHRLTRAVEQAGELIVIGDASGAIQYVNQAFEDLTGFTRAEVIGRPPLVASYDRRERDLFRRIRSTLLHGAVWRGRYVSRRKNGTLFELECTASPVLSPEGQFEGYVAVQRDASVEVHSTFEERLTQKLEVLGMIAGSFIREFNNQLQAIIGYGELAAESAGAPMAQESHLQHILVAAERAREASADFLAFLSCPEEQARLVPFRDVVAKSIKLLRTALPTSIEIEEQLGTETLTVQGNSTQLLMVVISLAVNASRPIWQGGGVLRVTLLSEPSPTGGDKPARGQPGAWVECRITSQPTAQPTPRPVDRAAVEEGLKHASPFGLAVVREVVQQHGGTIAVAEEEAGATGIQTVLRLPVTVALPGSRPTRPRAGAAATGKADGRIMFVDDESTLAELAQLELEDLGYHVTTFTSSLDAQDAFAADPDSVDLAIIDQTMPRLTGFELARNMLKIRPGIPIILITGYSDTVDSAQARAIGIRDYLLKPVTPEKLAEAIRQALSKA